MDRAILYLIGEAPIQIESEVKQFSLEELQHYVGGYIEQIPTRNMIGDVIANEDGLLLGMEYNTNASLMFGVNLVGPILYLEGAYRLK